MNWHKHHNMVTGLGTEFQTQDTGILIPSTVSCNGGFCPTGHHIVSLLHSSGVSNSEHFVWLICPFQRLLQYGTAVIVVPRGVQNTWLGNRKMSVDGKNTEHRCSLKHLSESNNCRDFQIINKRHALLTESFLWTNALSLGFILRSVWTEIRSRVISTAVYRAGNPVLNSQRGE
jgi:hypothetical protein